MSMFPVPEDFVSSFGKQNPFLSFFEDMQRNLKSMASDGKTPTVPMFPFMADPKQIEANIETAMQYFPFSDVTGLKNLSAHPIAAMSAANAMAVGAATHAFSAWVGFAGAMTDKMMADAQSKAEGGVYTHPMKFEWMSGPFANATEVMEDAIESTIEAVEYVSNTTKEMVEDTIETMADVMPEVAAEMPAMFAADEAAVEPTVPSAEIVQLKTPVVDNASEKLSVTAASVDDVLPEDFQKPKALDKPDMPDDLKMIAGVGPKLEKVLNGLGVWTFQQIADWTPAHVAWVDDYLQFKGRIVRDDWIAQADALAAGGADEYVRRFGQQPR